MLHAVELCAGAGGQALGLEQAGFHHELLIDNDHPSISTLRLNRPRWNSVEGDIRNLRGADFKGIDLIAGGVPCPPFSIAGKQLGDKDERDLFLEAIRLVDEAHPRAVMIENVRGLFSDKFAPYRKKISEMLSKMGYYPQWQLLNAADFGVPQLRPRALLVGVLKSLKHKFHWPMPNGTLAPTVGEALYDLMASRGWKNVDHWKKTANSIAPTIVGGSKKHGGPDLGPTRAKEAWAELGVNGHRVGLDPPDKDFSGSSRMPNMPYLTVRMVARLQGFPDDWEFFGSKTAAYRQVGNAFPPPVARAVGTQIAKCLR